MSWIEFMNANPCTTVILACATGITICTVFETFCIFLEKITK